MSLHVASFLLAVSLMFVHELDAMQRREWRIFPGLSRLDDTLGMQVFVWLHVPLFVLVVYFAGEAIADGGSRFSFWFGVFCVVHAFVHWAFGGHPACEFKNVLSRTIIWGCGAAGAVTIATA